MNSNIGLDTKEIEAKTILVKSKLPDADYVINPYTGCRFGCTYCYASFMGRFVGKNTDDWGNYVYIKTNAPKILEKELKKLGKNTENLSIFLSSVTDPYQGVEAKYKLTRQCLQIIANSTFEGMVSILTKSDLVLRDLDILKKLRNVEVGLTITSTDDKISRYFEKMAPNSSQRLNALKILNKNNIKTYAFIGPLLPHFVSKQKELDNLFYSIKSAGTNDVYIEHINLSPYILQRFKKEAKDIDPKIMKKFYESQNKYYRDELDVVVKKLLQKHKIHLKLNETIYHKDL